MQWNDLDDVTRWPGRRKTMAGSRTTINDDGGTMTTVQINGDTDGTIT
jgi:hypothetical protein